MSDKSESALGAQATNTWGINLTEVFRFNTGNKLRQWIDSLPPKDKKDILDQIKLSDLVGAMIRDSTPQPVGSHVYNP